MQTYRLKTSDIQGTPIDPEWQQFLLKEHGIQSTEGDYFFEDIQGTMRVMEKDKFERLFDLVEDPTTAPSPTWLQKHLPILGALL